MKKNEHIGCVTGFLFSTLSDIPTIHTSLVRLLHPVENYRPFKGDQFKKNNASIFSN